MKGEKKKRMITSCASNIMSLMSPICPSHPVLPSLLLHLLLFPWSACHCHSTLHSVGGCCCGLPRSSSSAMDCPSMVDAPGGLGSRMWRPLESVSQLGCSSVPSALRWVVLPGLWMQVSWSIEGAARHGPACSPIPAGGEPTTSVVHGAIAGVEQGGSIL